MSDADNTTETETGTGTGTEDTGTKQRLLEHSPASRRDFMRFSAASVAAASVGPLALSETARGDHVSPKASELYDFVRNHVTDEYQIPTLLSLTDKTGFEALDRLNLETEDGQPVEFVQTTDPEPAAYAQLTPVQADTVLVLSEVEQAEFSPGSNPFWKLGNYEDGVFPAVSDSVDYIGFEQMVDGFKQLESENSDRLNFFSRGHSPGYRNILTGDSGQQKMWFVEITNDVNDDKSFKEKKKPVLSLSIHGDEHQGREAGCRMAERILNGEVSGMDEILNEVAIVFVFTNPDGWIVRNPQFIGQDNEFARQNGAERDLNRSYPTEGWIAPDHYSGESWGADVEDDQPGEIDDDVPKPVVAHVPDALAVTEQLRSYENISTLVDMHGQGLSPVLIYTLTPNSDQFNHEQLHDLNEMTRYIGETIRGELGSVEQRSDAISEGFEVASEGEDVDIEPQELFRAGSSVDTLGYTTTGGLRSFVAGRTEFSGLDTKSITIELAFSAIPFTPNVLDFQVDAYMAAIRGVVEYAATSLEATVSTDGRTTAYVTTDAVTRTSDDLVFADIGEFTTSNLDARRDSGVRTVVTVAPEPDEPGAVRFTVAEAAGALEVSLEHEGAITATLVNPAGDTVRTYNASEENNTAEWEVTSPTAGEWTIHVENTTDGDVEVRVTADEYLKQGADDDSVLTPDPVNILGFEQQEYQVTPFQYFKDNSQFLVANSNGNGNSNCNGHGNNNNGKHDNDDSNDEHSKDKHHGKNLMDPVSVSEVCEGALLDDGEVAYDNVVVIHAEAADDADYVGALDAFVNAGGNLILTDTGVQHLGTLETDLAAGLTGDDIETITRQFALLGEEPYLIDNHRMGKNLDHRLLDGVRPVQQELWNVAGLGYASPNFEAPMTLVDTDAFENAGGEVAGVTDGHVSVGALERDDSETGIQVIASVLPPAYQRNLHPFGMLDYGVEFMGHTIMLNALGYEQQRFVDGELTSEWNTSVTDSDH